MTQITWPKNVSSLLKQTGTLLVVAPAARFEDGTFLEILPEDHMRLALDLAQDVKPGDWGDAAGTLTGTQPRKLGIGVLPDKGSRYNSPARAAAITKVVRQTGTGKRGKAAILLVLDDPEHYQAAACAVARALPLYDARSKKAEASSLKILAIGPDGEPITASAVVKSTAEYLREAARLVDTPPTEMDPPAFQKDAYRMLRGMEKVTKKAIIGPKLLEAGLGGLHAVGRTALGAPRLLVLTHKPRARSKVHVALVGKGVTYDTGGLSIKSTAGMCGMKGDMGGAAAVLGAFLTLVQSKSPCTVSAVICLAENAIGPSSYKNDDILHMHSGKTVEINNTDAEGRLLLGDGVSYAARQLKATHVLDAATLTGAQLMATGNHHAAVISNDEQLEQQLVAAGRASGDLVHPLMFAPELYRKEFSSHVADMRNSVANRMNAQVSCAAQFVYSHLEGTDVKWGHVDLAGPAWTSGRGTGFGVALLAESVRRIAAE
ncbi:MAG: putative aminopeptidase NPEPL1 [Planctomycetota bacterium]|jgi:probable aminopeptidase NPEPL1